MGARKRQRDVATPYKPQKPQLAGEMKAVAERLEEDRKSLPIWSARNKLVHLVRENQCLVVVGETGSGKTTQIPQFLLRADVAGDKAVACTQPRRVAAASVARRVAQEVGTRLGGKVGYQVRFEDVTSPSTRIKYMTDGMLLREALADPSLSRYGVVIVDEAHERSVHTDVLLGLLKGVLAKRGPSFRLVIMSATLDAGKFARFFGDCPVAHVLGRTYPVEVQYTPTPEDDYLDACINTVLQIHSEEGPGDILVFLTGQEEIEAAERLLREKAESLERHALLELASQAGIPLEGGSNPSWAETSAGGGGAGEVSHREGTTSSTGGEREGAGDGGTIDEIFDPTNRERMKEEVKRRKKEGAPLGHDVAEGDTGAAVRRAMDAELRGRVGTGGQRDGGVLGAKALRLFLEQRGVATAGRDGRPLRLIVRPIFAAMAPEAQMAAFERAPPGARKVILATNIAETSVTINGVRYVVDSGFVKSRMYSARAGAESLQVVPVSRAQARQRSGRAGREAPGKAFRIYTEDTFFKDLAETTPPEILRTNLGSVVLQLKAMGINDVLHFDFLDPPPRASLLRALEMLYALGALDAMGRLTDPVGKRMARLPVDPMFARALLKAEELGCASEMCAVAAMVSTDHVFFTPRGKQKEADKARKRFVSNTGDHVTLLTVYTAFLDVPARERAGWCRDNFLNMRSLSKAQDIDKQLRGHLESIGMKLGRTDALVDSTMLRKALTAGLFPHAARKQPDGMFKVLATGQTVAVHPSSAVSRNKPDYVIFNEVVATTKQYARGLSAIEGSWLPVLAPSFFTTQKMLGHAGRL